MQYCHNNSENKNKFPRKYNLIHFRKWFEGNSKPLPEWYMDISNYIKSYGNDVLEEHDKIVFEETDVAYESESDDDINENDIRSNTDSDSDNKKTKIKKERRTPWGIVTEITIYFLWNIDQYKYINIFTFSLKNIY